MKVQIDKQTAGKRKENKRRRSARHARRRPQDADRKTQAARLRPQDSGRRTQAAGRKTQDARRRGKPPRKQTNGPAPRTTASRITHPTSHIPDLFPPNGQLNITLACLHTATAATMQHGTRRSTFRRIEALREQHLGTRQERGEARDKQKADKTCPLPDFPARLCPLRQLLPFAKPEPARQPREKKEARREREGGGEKQIDCIQPRACTCTLF